MNLRYLCSLIVGAAISLGLLTVSKDLASPAVADADTGAVFSVFDQPLKSTLVAQVYDDGRQLPGGAYVSPPADKATTATPTKTVVVYRTTSYGRNGWWTRGPIRRVISWPIRRLIARRCR